MSQNTNRHQRDLLEDIFIKNALIFIIMTNQNEHGHKQLHFPIESTVLLCVQLFQQQCLIII